jgi:hypothetical protein
MSFKDNINSPIVKEMQRDYNRAIAQKIRNRLQQLENANEKDKRRWIWELLQNANDTVSGDRKVDVAVTTTDEGIEFSHNGGYFSPRNITNLVHQISSKEGEENIGRFGTGFLTTHTLSRVIEVSGVYTDENKYYQFKITLDRTGNTEAELIGCINSTWETFEEILLTEEPKQTIWTKFKYLNHHKEVAQNTIKDFETFIHYNLAFVQSIGSVIIDNKLSNHHFLIKRKEIQVINETLSIIHFEEINNRHQTEKKLLLADDSTIQAAIEITNRNTDGYSIKKIANNIPRLFCAFPLIGTENFHFPMVLNSRNFMPKTERDGLYLKGDTLQTKHNKSLLENILPLYHSVLNYCSTNDVEQLYLLAQIKNSFQEDDYFDTEWYTDTIQKPIQNSLLTIPIVKTATGRFETIKNIQFPYHARDQKLDLDITEQLWEFQAALYPHLIPQESDIENWANIIWEGCTKINLERFARYIQKFESIDLLEKALKLINPETKVFTWSNNLIGFYLRRGNYILNKYKICPNQEKENQGYFCFKDDLYVDDNIQEELKDVYEVFTDKTSWREELLSRNIITLEHKLKEEKKIRQPIHLIQAIDARIEQENTDKEQVKKAVFSLISLLPQEVKIENEQEETEYKKLREYRNNVYRFNNALFKAAVPETKIVPNLPPKTWEVADKWALELLVETIEKSGDTTTLSEKLNLGTKEEASDWLNDLFIFFLKEDKVIYLSNKIYPNQLGCFAYKSSLYQDQNIAEEFKDILAELNELIGNEKKSWRNILLDKRITVFVEQAKLQNKTTQDISDAINKIIIEQSNSNLKGLKKVLFKLATFVHSENRHQRKFWEFLRAYYLDEVPKQLQFINNAENFDWKTCFLSCMELLISDISNLKELDILESQLHGDVEVIDWLNDFLDFIHETASHKRLLDGDFYAITPNQNRDFQYKNGLWLDGEIDEDLKHVISLLNKSWLDNILDQNIYLALPRVKTTEDAAIEVDRIFRNYNGDVQDSEYVEAFRTASSFLNKIDLTFIRKNMSWVYDNKANLALSVLGSDKEKDEIFQIIQSGKAPLLSKIANNEDFTNKDLEKLLENSNTVKEFLGQITNKEGLPNNILLALNIKEETGDEADSLGELITKYKELKETVKDFKQEEDQKKPKFSFRTELSNSSSSADLEAIRLSNELAREHIYEHLKTLNEYDLTAWTKETNTIIKNVKKQGITIGLVTKGADNKTIYINSAEVELLSDTKNFSELWVHSHSKVYQITLGEILKVWNVQRIEIDMFDFFNKI